MFKLSRVLIIIVIAVIVAGAGFGGVIWFLNQSDEDEDDEAEAAVVEPVMYDAGDYVTNLADPNSRRFISVHIMLEVTGDEVVSELDDRSIAVRDRVLGVLRSYTYAEVSGNEGMYKVGQDIVDALNRLLQQGRVVNIYFSEFIVQ